MTGRHHPGSHQEPHSYPPDGVATRRPWQEDSARTHATWYEPLVDPEQIRAAVSWVLAHEEVTGLATAGDVRLLRHLVAAERERMDVLDAEAALVGVEDYSSPFVTMPF